MHGVVSVEDEEVIFEEKLKVILIRIGGIVDSVVKILDCVELIISY